MTKKILFSILIMLTLLCQVTAQKSLPGFKSKDFKAVELLIGTGTRYPGTLTTNLNIRKNFGRHISGLTFSYLDIKPYARNPDKTYLAIKYTNVLQSVGIGSSIGKKGFNAGLYLLGGIRYHHAVEAVNGFHEPKIVTNALLPDAALLLNMKIGKRRFYFSSQLYYQLTPIDPAIRLMNLTMGLGYRF